MGRALESVILGKRLVRRSNIRWLFQLPRRHQEEEEVLVCRSRNRKRNLWEEIEIGDFVYIPLIMAKNVGE